LRLLCVRRDWAAGCVEGAALVLIHARGTYYTLVILINPTGIQDLSPAPFSELLCIFNVVSNDPFIVVTRELPNIDFDAGGKHPERALNLHSRCIISVVENQDLWVPLTAAADNARAPIRCP
jgi:hypothetical protein